MSPHSHDGILKMTFWIALLWMLDVYPGWIVGYIKATYLPNITGAMICYGRMWRTLIRWSAARSAASSACPRGG